MARLVISILAFVAGVAVFAETVTYDFVWDDDIIIDDKVRHYRGPLDVWREPSDLAGLRVYRPITFGSYWLDTLLWGRDPAGFHATGILLHAVNAALVPQLALALGCGPPAALVAGVLFAVHPIHSEAVSWIACRADLLVTLFVILSLLAALHDRRAPHPLLLAGIGTATFAAVASKEVGVVAPLLVLAVDACSDRPPDGRRVAARHVAVRPVVAAIGVVAYLVLRPSDRSVGLGLAMLGVDAIVRLLGTLGFYVAQTLAPWGTTAFVPEAPVAPGLLLLATLALAAAGLLFYRGERPGTLRRFGLTWCALALGPPLLVAVAEMLQTKASERYVYLPSVGLALLVAGELAARPALLGRHAIRIAMAGVLVGLALVTGIRNRIWRDDGSLWSAVTVVESRFMLPFGNLGFARKAEGRLEAAETALTTALTKRGSSINRRLVLINLGQLRLQQRRSEEAIPLFEEANAIGPHAWALHGLGIAYRWRGRAHEERGDTAGAAHARAEAERSLRAGLAINARNINLHFVLAGVLYDQGRFEDALAHYRQATALGPESEAGRQAAAAGEELAAWLARQRR